MTVRLLILGTGGMARNHAEGFGRIAGVELVAGVDTRPVQLAAFCEKHGIPHGFASVADAVDWGQFDAVTNVTPDAAHFVTTVPMLSAGKHVLCEKPLALTAADAEAMTVAAEAAGVVNMVNMTYRNGAALQKAAVMVADGVIGKIRHFEASYLQSWLTQPTWGDWRDDPQWLWRLSSAHGSKGVLGDVGIHILDFATFIAGEQAVDVSARLATFDKAPDGRIGDYTLDANDSATMQIRLEGGALGVVHVTRFATGHMNDLRLRIYGDLGGLEVRSDNHVSTMRACIGPDRLTATWREVDCPATASIYERFIAAIRGQAPMIPDFARGALLQHLLDRAGESAQRGGLVLPV